MTERKAGTGFMSKFFISLIVALSIGGLVGTLGFLGMRDEQVFDKRMAEVEGERDRIEKNLQMAMRVIQKQSGLIDELKIAVEDLEAENGRLKLNGAAKFPPCPNVLAGTLEEENDLSDEVEGLDP